MFACMYVHCVCAVMMEARRASGPLELELLVIVICHVGSGNRAQTNKSS